MLLPRFLRFVPYVFYREVAVGSFPARRRVVLVGTLFDGVRAENRSPDRFAIR